MSVIFYRNERPPNVIEFGVIQDKIGRRLRQDIKDYAGEYSQYQFFGKDRDVVCNSLVY